MADKKITDLPASAGLAAADLFEVVDDVGGTPTSQKATLTQLRVALMPIVVTSDVSGILPAANGGTGASSLPAGGLAGLTAMAAGDAAAEANAATASAAAITAERTATRTLTGATIAGASNTLDARIANDVSGLGAGVATLLAATPSGTTALAGVTSPTFRTGILLNNPANTFAYTFTPAAIAAARTITLPLLTAGDTMAVLAFAQTFTNKTIAGASNTLTVRLANDVTGVLPIANGGNGHAGAVVAVAALAIDWTAGSVFTKTLSAGGNTFTFTNAAGGLVITVRLTSNGGGSTVTWPTVRWAGGVAPTQTSTGTDVYTFVHDGSNIYGSVVQTFA